jgi:hypothetical protein
MAPNTADRPLLLVKKLVAVVLILFGIIGIAVGLEYRTTGFSSRNNCSGHCGACLGYGAPRDEDHPT